MQISQDQLSRLQADFETAHPYEILQWAATTFGDTLAVVTSFQPTGIVTLHMLQEIAPQTPVLTLDTELLFPETYTLIETIQAQFNLNLHRIKPQYSVEEQAARYGDRMWETQPNRCCHMRKVVPLRKALAPYAAWITGLRRDQSSGRANVPVIDFDTTHNSIKLSPFATWTESRVWDYLHAYDLPYNTLHDQGYPSIGCFPCTQASQDANDKRSGRWANQEKTECGIHLPQTAIPLEGLPSAS